MTRKYYPNNWKSIKDTPDNFFPGDLTYKDFESWKIHGYMIPDSVTGMLRITDSQTGKIYEKTYSSEHGLRKQLRRCFEKNEAFVLCTDEGLFQRSLNDYPTDFNDDRKNT